MPTDECIVDNYKKSKEEYPNSISFEREIEEAKKWVSNENLKFAEKYPDQIPQPEQTGHYHIVRNLLFAVKTLTARAEQAEKERDAAINALNDYEDALYPTVEDMMRDLNTL